MGKAEKASTLPTKPCSEAWLAFEKNIESILHMVHMGGREIRRVEAAAIRLDKLLKKWADPPGTTAFASRRLRSIERFAKTIQVPIERFGTANLWQVVMLVTCAEAYLQDLLSAAAGAGPELMRKSEQQALYADVVAAGSIGELANSMRVRWARAWLNEGGPKRWIVRLEKMGARNYPVGLASRLELIWGIRHTVVHAAGIAGQDFVKRHPGVVATSGSRLHVSSKDFGSILLAVRSFLEPTEAFFVARYPTLLAQEFKTAIV